VCACTPFREYIEQQTAMASTGTCSSYSHFFLSFFPDPPILNLKSLHPQRDRFNFGSRNASKYYSTPEALLIIFSKFRLQPYRAFLFLTPPSLTISYFIRIASLHNHTNKEWQLVHLITVWYKVGAGGAQLVYLMQTMQVSSFSSTYGGQGI